ncbi:MAG: gliding motility-associated C-terminal domain-containing protein [Bacteroidia bacterium]|nr:gliding motility-associated C-terminal domain-containing protein [Bacteroidia bacterium]
MIKRFSALLLLAGGLTAVAQVPTANFNAVPTVVCQGSNVSFFDASTGGPTAWSWSFPGGTPATSTNQNPTITYTSPGVYNVTLTVSNVNGSNTLTQTNYITVQNPPSTPLAGPDQQICNDTATLQGNTPTFGIGTWSVIFGGGVVSQVNNPSSIVTGLTPGINILIWTIANAPCSPLDDTVRILVDLPPTPANAGPDQNICPPNNFTTLAGNTVFVGSGMWTLLSGNGVVTTPTSPTSGVTSLGTGANQFIWTTSNGTCPPSMDTVTINYLTPPSIAINPPSLFLCSGNSFTLQATGGLTYTWAPATGLSATTGSSVMANPTTTITYTVTGTDVNGCTNTGTTIITVTPFPTITVSMANTTTCSNSPMQITASGANGYTWSPASGLSATTGSIVSCLPTASTTYTVIGNTNGCTDTITFTMNVIPAPTATVNPPAGLICQGNNLNLTGGGGVSYNWFPSTGLSATTGATVTAAPTVTTQYYVIAIAANGCSDTAGTLIVVNPPPNVSITPNNPSVCTGDSLTLIASGSLNYSWSPATFLSSTTNDTVMCIPTTTVTYTVTGTASGCPPSTSTVTVTVNLTPTVTVTPNTIAICQGSFTNLTASGASSYTWAPGGTLSSTTGAIVTAMPTTATSYTVTGTSVNGCTSTAIVNVNVNPLFMVNTAGMPATCGNPNSGQATATTNGGTAPFTYLWNDPFGQTTQTASALTPGTYTVIVTDANGCSQTQSVTITSLNTMALNMQYADPLCSSGNTGTATVTVTSGTTPFTYSWNTVPAQSTAQATGLAPGTYTVVVTDSSGCTQSIAVTLVSPPALSLVTDTTVSQCKRNDGGAHVTSVSGGTSPYTYLWNNGGTNNEIEMLAPGTYSVLVTDFNGCTDSASFTIVDWTTEYCVYLTNAFSPNGDGQHDTWYIENLDYYSNVSLEIFNRWGHLVFREDDYKNNWDGKDAKGKALPGGSYYYVLKLSPNDEPIKGILTILK